jgi:hypothetical protein
MKSSGTQQLTASGVVGTSGAPIRVWKWTIGSGGTAGLAKLRSGTTASGVIFAEDTGTINIGGRNLTDFGATGLFFPNGCYCEMDVNTTAVTIAYTQE